jgi:hypothetical protein
MAFSFYFVKGIITLNNLLLGISSWVGIFYQPPGQLVKRENKAKELKMPTSVSRILRDLLAPLRGQSLGSGLSAFQTALAPYL